MGGGASTPRAADPASGSSPSDRSLTDASVEALITLIAAATLEATPPLGAAAAIEDMVAQAWTRTADRELRGAQAARIACELARAAAARGVVGSGEDAASGGASMNEAQLRALLAGTLASATRADERDELAELVEQLPGAAPAAGAKASDDTPPRRSRLSLPVLCCSSRSPAPTAAARAWRRNASWSKEEAMSHGPAPAAKRRHGTGAGSAGTAGLDR